MEKILTLLFLPEESIWTEANSRTGQCMQCAVPSNSVVNVKSTLLTLRTDLLGSGLCAPGHTLMLRLSISVWEIQKKQTKWNPLWDLGCPESYYCSPGWRIQMQVHWVNSGMLLLKPLCCVSDTFSDHTILPVLKTLKILKGVLNVKRERGCSCNRLW